ncbi:hypothetical protein SLEP1_g27773 [Rubroshorea leprosula]|uniref:Transmembrane protein n=1 Tax=Rubroshorea leprosula TaxID=152421 RepID=A0AAV5K0S7_9ROSI|nr:hypothetical protein SLEP1_g27773 [Rubroshorea leprosula]
MRMAHSDGAGLLRKGVLVRKNDQSGITALTLCFSFVVFFHGEARAGVESEIELRNPTRKRSRRNQKPITSEGGNQNLEREEKSKEMEKEKKCWGRVKRKGRIRKKKVNFENDFN